VRCYGCITVHTEAAIRHGATREEIADALDVAVAVKEYRAASPRE
jgi:AhpD family alkylhydroperoxidase